MSIINRLISNYSRQVRLPWSTNIAGTQRVWFAVYPPVEERRVRAQLPRFEEVTLQTNHKWSIVDLTKVLPEWLSRHEYREGIFAEPEYFTVTNEIETKAAEMVRHACAGDDGDTDSVIAVIGLASLFDVIRVSSLIDRIEDTIRGRLLVFFPGEFAGNVYRFMDARDGFNYMAVPITSTESFVKP